MGNSVSTCEPRCPDCCLDCCPDCCLDCCPCCSQKKNEKTTIKRQTCTSIYNYASRTTLDLELKKGDILEIMGENEDWLYVRRRTAKGQGIIHEEGYVPKNFVKPVESLEAQPWYFADVKRRIEAKRCLARPQNDEGAFLVWKSDENDTYYLSVKNSPHARHYKIKQGEHYKNFFLVQRTTFKNLPELIEYYSKSQNGLCVKLNQPCVKLDQPAPPTLSFQLNREIDKQSLTKIKMLGSGEFADVWQGKWNGTTDVAIKEFKAVSPNITTEIEIMMNLRHERLLQLYAICTTNKPFCIVTELMNNGSLKTFLTEQKKEKKDIEFSLMMDFAIQITEGMIYLEDKIVHRDLRADNILLTNMQSCKIADFGLAQFVLTGNRRLSSGELVPVKWMAPEIFEDKNYTSKSDVWSFGILLTEIVTYGDEPYSGQDKQTCILGIKRGKRMERPAGCPEALYDIMLQCWKTNPAERPTFTELQEKLMALINEPVSDLE
ncbi:tyrosine-protein kinase SRK2 [Triplophysa dalaica]|uniref:tyrosine-protein kinase SRK2 n=1 Tax=Triplophysa dalaica TaxID=1582913 RepID=UPI0024DFE8A2|nr:tyrosine-protein kinase SRK2 [Triplophysa dalaica]